MKALSKAEVMREYAHRWPITHACMTALTFLGAQVLSEPLLALARVAPGWSYGERVALAAIFGAAMTALARNAGSQASRPAA